MISLIIRKASKRLRVLLALRNAIADTEKRLANKNIRKILVLCYGNIYRSPLVAQYLRNKLGQEFEVRSAGFHPKSDRPSPEAHIKVCAEHQVDLSKHKSSVINNELVAWADVIVIMDKHNWYALVDYGDEAVSKVVWLGTLLGKQTKEICDPYGKPEEQLKDIVQQLLEFSDKLVMQLR
jgi:protein-tyrosine-phosphatase